MITKFANVIKNIGPAMQHPCTALTTAKMILQEGEHPAEVREQVEKMARLQKEMCDAYNKLRSLTGQWENDAGVEKPTFYVKPYEETGEPVVCGGTCACGRLVVDLPALKPADEDAGNAKGHVQEHER